MRLVQAFLVAEAEGTAPSISREEFGMECFFFLVASIANTNATLVLVLYELLRRSELQEKVLAQAAAALAAHGGVWCDAVSDMYPSFSPFTLRQRGTVTVLTPLPRPYLAACHVVFGCVHNTAPYPCRSRSCSPRCTSSMPVVATAFSDNSTPLTLVTGD